VGLAVIKLIKANVSIRPTAETWKHKL